MSALINWDFAVNRWAETMLDLSYAEGPEEVDERCKNLPAGFHARLVAALKGEDMNGQPY